MVLLHGRRLQKVGQLLVGINSERLERVSFLLRSNAFDEHNEEDVSLVNLWKSKSKPTYKMAIETWTIRDPKKRKIAKQNNLNWLEFFNIKEFKNWFNSLSPIS